MPAIPQLPLIQRRILRWYRHSARDFPWRRTRDPYRILVSEVMLQQTQVNRVVGFYRAFMKRFTTLKSLAVASPGSVLEAWQGLGYNMRALRLHALAVQVHKTLKGRFPKKVEDLEQLPGIGPYTARAVACFSFGVPVAVLDTNVRRVLHRLFPRAAGSGNLWNLAERVLSRRSSNDWNQALMELGSTICTAAAPSCPDCPVGRRCPSYGRAARVAVRAGSPERLYRGFPRRIHRGRVVGLLGAAGPRTYKTVPSIGRAILPSFTRGDETWLREVLLGLERDSLIRIKKDGQRWSASLVR